MKKAMILALSALALVGCYDKYTMDYDYTAVYAAYQYDLRTFVIGEDMRFDFTVALAGVVNNDRDRAVAVSIDEELLQSDLSAFSASQVDSFTALQGLLGTAPIGDLCQPYVSQEVAASKIKSLEPLPTACYRAEGLDGLSIRKGRHTAAVTIAATDEIRQDDKALRPYYALAFRIDEADADAVIPEKSFAIVAVKCEHTLYGNWYHSGKSVVMNDLTGEVVSQESYPLSLPQADDKVYALTTAAFDAVVTDKGAAGRMKLMLDGEHIRLESADGTTAIREIEGQPCSSNGAKLLQDRKLFLNYAFDNADGTTTYVTDTLTFRNRVRDGINEWQDENPEHYR